MIIDLQVRYSVGSRFFENTLLPTKIKEKYNDKRRTCKIEVVGNDYRADNSYRKNGVGDTLIKQIDEQLESRELIKISVLKNARFISQRNRRGTRCIKQIASSSSFR